jgi:hypothetical protein
MPWHCLRQLVSMKRILVIGATGDVGPDHLSTHDHKRNS